jgi:hypothetical protein
MYTITTFRTYVTSIHQNCNRKMFAVLFEVRDRVTFGCASLKELDLWVDALQLLLYHTVGMVERVAGKTSVQIPWRVSF